jgi:DNA-binding transcriptional ArsR family regulator
MADDRCDLLCLDLPRAEVIRNNRLDPELAQRLAGRAGGLADPTRLMLAAALLEAGELCVCDLSWISGRATNLVSHHLRFLRNHGLVRSRRDGKLVIYGLTEEGCDLVRAVLDVGPSLDRDAMPTPGPEAAR